MPKLLLHACCGPCTTIPLDLLLNEGYDVSVAYVNPNIHPKAEYDKRLESLAGYLKDKGVELIEGDYEADSWQQQVGVFGGPYPLLENPESVAEANALSTRRQRCKMCYRMRLDAAATIARKIGASHIATTLSISPFQFSDLINSELTLAASRKALMPLIRDYRSEYPQSVNVARELGLYRQNYCGCSFSKLEADIERDARKSARKTANHEAK